MMKKRIFTLTITMFLLISCCINVFASDTDETLIYNFTEEGKRVEFSADTVLTPAQREIIADRLVHGYEPTEGATTYSWCWLLGHEESFEYVSVITHRAVSTTPRCLEQTYEVTVCANCDYYSERLVAQGYITCCPED